jgi:exopolysaccharide biosynthesis protein
MRDFLRKPGRWAATFGALLALGATAVLLQAFVIPQELTPSGITVPTQPDSTPVPVPTSEPAASSNPTVEQPVTTQNSYDDGQISIAINQVRAYDTDVYVADIKLASADLLKSALAEGRYGRNISQTTSDMAADNNAILAINGDYYGFRNAGYVLRDGVAYRDSANGQGLVIDTNGDFSIVDETQVSLSEIANTGAWQVFSFGPGLIQNGEIVVGQNDEVSQSKNSNPRTAIAQVGPLHYLMVVSDGRTNSSAGLSLYQLATVMQQYGAVTAYNLDGGGSSTMVFNGQVINNPTSGRSIKEREVSDIVYIGH